MIILFSHCYHVEVYRYVRYSWPMNMSNVSGCSTRHSDKKKKSEVPPQINIVQISDTDHDKTTYLSALEHMEIEFNFDEKNHKTSNLSLYLLLLTYSRF